MNILFIGAHPDDIELSAGGYLLNSLKNGHSCFAMVFSGLYHEIRRYEINNSFSYLEMKFPNFSERVYNFPDTELYKYEDEIKNIIEKNILNYDIDRCVTHFFKDTHRDHRSISQASIDAARKISIICYESPNVYEFEPNYYIKLDEETLNEKIKLMSYHKSQNDKNDNFYLKKIKAAAEFRGLSVYTKYAEAYHIIRMIGE